MLLYPRFFKIVGMACDGVSVYTQNTIFLLFFSPKLLDCGYRREGNGSLYPEVLLRKQKGSKKREKIKKKFKKTS